MSRVNDQTPPESVQLGRKGARAGAPGQKSASLLFVLGLIAAIRATVAAAAAAGDLLEVFGVELLHLITPFELGGVSAAGEGLIQPFSSIAKLLRLCNKKIHKYLKNIRCFDVLQLVFQCDTFTILVNSILVSK
ncbi:hypothetical protein RVU70_10370 [Methylocystis echinoides]